MEPRSDLTSAGEEPLPTSDGMICWVIRRATAGLFKWLKESIPAVLPRGYRRTIAPDQLAAHRRACAEFRERIELLNRVLDHQLRDDVAIPSALPQPLVDWVRAARSKSLDHLCAEPRALVELRKTIDSSWFGVPKAKRRLVLPVVEAET